MDGKKKPAAAAAAEPVLSRPDAVSARVTAAAQGSRVEIESARTEVSTSWANPDGTTTTSTYAGQIRYKENGVWKDVDLALEATPDGGVAARRHPHGLKLAGKTKAATEELLTVSAGTGREVALGWSGQLPAPKVEGTTATYPDITPGVDMIIESRRSGFEQHFQLRERPTGPMSWDLPLRTKGLTARAEADGSVSFLNAKGGVVSMIPAPIAWDAAVDPNTGDHASTSPVALTVTQKGKGKAVLTITPDPAWLTDPARVLPITVDPAYAYLMALYSNFDAFVQSDVTTDQSTSTELKIGNNGAGQKARSFIKFGSGEVVNVVGKQVMSAKLWLNAKHSWSCTARRWDVWDTEAAGSATRWTSQPHWGASKANSTITKGYSSSCAGGWVSQNITDLVRDHWADTGGARTLGLRAYDETDEYGWKKFHSSETSYPPYIEVTYNRAPNPPINLTQYPIASYDPPGAAPSADYATTQTPTLRALVVDPDENSMNLVLDVYDAQGTDIGGCSISNVASGTNASCDSSALPASGGPFRLVVKATDSNGKTTVSQPDEFYVATLPPAAPSLTCPAPHAAGSWQATVPAAPVNCTVTGTGSGATLPKAIEYVVDGGDLQTVPASSAAPASASVPVPNTSGAHVVLARSVGPSGLTSPWSSLTFGYGTLGLMAPAADAMATTAGPIRVTVTGPGGTGTGAPSAALRWRLAGEPDLNAGWHTVESEHAVLDVTGGAGQLVSATAMWDAAASIKEKTGTDRVPVRIEIQACLTYPGTPEQCTTAPGSTGPVPLQYVPHAFGNGFPVADAGPGQVALWTGEFQTSATDVSVPGYTGALSISRSHSTYAGDSHPDDPMARILGPGWKPNLDGPSAGVAGWTVLDNTWRDATLVLLPPTGSPLVYTTPSKVKRTSTGDLPAGIYDAATEDTKLFGARVEVSGTGAGATIKVSEDDGTVTAFVASVAPAPNKAAILVPATVAEVGTPVTRFVTGTGPLAGKVTRIVAAAPGVTCALNPDPAVALHTKGCRALRLSYAPAGSDHDGQLTSVTLDIWDPGANEGQGGFISPVVAAYDYDGEDRLIKVTDSRTGLAVEYGYDGGSPRVKSVKPAGLTEFQLHYADRDGSKMLAKVTRARPAGDPAGGTATLASYVYGVPTSGDELPNLSAGAVAAWNQYKAPTYGAAVFGPDHPVDGIGPAGKTEHWKHASLVYTDALGYTVNTAAFGAGAWQLTASDYDSRGNVVRELDSTALATVMAANLPAGINADQLATLTTYNTEDIVVSGSLTAAGALIKESFGPARHALVKDSSAAGPCPGQECLAWVRPHTVYTYDQGAPGDGLHETTKLPYRLLTTSKTTVEDPASGAELETLSLIRHGYQPLETGDASGWKLGLPTTTTTDMGGGTDIVAKTRYDAEGRVIETRQPGTAAGSAGARVTSYYTAGANPNTDCDNTPEWAGLVCQIAPGNAASGSALPTTHTKAYSALLAPSLIEETSGAVKRTTRISYTNDGRISDNQLTASGLADSAPVKVNRAKYDPATGLQTDLVELTGWGGTETSTRQTTGYDSWGRPISYQPSGGDAATTTSYDAAGRVASVTDPTGTTTWAYNGAGTNGVDALGKVERRGLPTKVTVSNPGGPEITVTGAYHPNGSLLTQTLPGGITQTTDYNSVGQSYGLTYTGQVGDNPRGTWLAWSSARDGAGRIRQEWTPAGAAYTDNTTGGAAAATAYERRYSYDRAGRLSTVNDRTATAGVVATDPNNPSTLTAVCTTRTYTFDVRGNRTGLDIWQDPAAAGTCGTPGAPANTTWNYNGADQITGRAGDNGNYLYDPLGRASRIPAADSPRGPGHGPVDIEYYDSDAVRKLTQNGTSTVYTLDLAGRRQNATTTNATGTTVLERHYTDASDNPGWVVETTGGVPSTTRFASSLGGDLPIEITGSSATLRLANPHGDTVTTVTVPAAGPATSITAWSDYDEYGQPRTPGSTGTIGGAGNYAWLGGKERATDDTGLLLMGARLYNPVTGQFTSTDPVFGGNATAYSYPADPVNGLDLDGRVGCGILAKACTLIKKAGKGLWNHAVEAAACAVTGVYGCAMIASLSKMASDIARARFRDTDKQNAVRHFIWQVGISIYVGSHAAYVAGKAHEFGKKNDYDRKTDEANNRRARAWASTNRFWALGVASTSSVSFFMNEMASIGDYLFDIGYLHSVEDFR